MLFTEVIGHEHIKRHLQESTKKGRIPHAQLFIGKEGTGTLPMAIAYAKLLLCHTSKDPAACAIKCDKLQHPDLHFVFPVTTNDKVKKHPVSKLFLEDWRAFIAKNPYGSLFNWLQHIGVEKKQGIITVEEAKNIVKTLSLKSYEGGYKVMIIWMAEKMNTEAANKLLKLIEEPPEQTVFILIAEAEQQLLKTITSRCQAVYFKGLSEMDIVTALVEKESADANEAMRIAHQSEGNYNHALHLLQNNSKDLIFEEWLIVWIRTAFKAKGNPGVVRELITWSNAIAAEGREVQKQFLRYCLEFFRQAMLLNYKADDLVYMQPKTANFQMKKFAPFVHSGNILRIEKELNDACYHIERNGNAKIILLDLSIKLTRLLHTKEPVI